MQEKLLETPQEQYTLAKVSERRLKAWLKIINWRGKRTRQGDSTDIRFLEWARNKAKDELLYKDYSYFMVAYGNRYREALRLWARAAVARKKGAI